MIQVKSGIQKILAGEQPTMTRVSLSPADHRKLAKELLVTVPEEEVAAKAADIAAIDWVPAPSGFVPEETAEAEPEPEAEQPD